MKRNVGFSTSDKGTAYHERNVRYSHNRFNTTKDTTSYTSFVDKDGVVHRSSFTDTETHSNVGAFNGVFSIILSILVLVNIFLTLTDSGQFIGFERFLEICSNAWVIPTDWLTNFSNLGIEASSWGAFSFFANFLNRLKDFVSVCAFLGVGCVQIITYIIYFLGAFLFV